MTYNQLLYFVTAAKYCSITKAAKSLFVTQPAISVAIKSLEQELETNLFIRNNNQLALTDYGKFVYQEAMQLIDKFTELNERINKYIASNRSLHIGIPPMIGTFLFPKLFNEFSKQAPNIKLITTEIGSIALLKALKNGEIMLAITSANEYFNDKEIDSYTIMTTELVYSVHKTHHLASQKTIPIELLKDEPLILMKEDSYQFQVLNERFLNANINPNVILTSNQLYTIKQLLLYNNAGAFMFKEVVDDDSDLVGISLDNPIYVDINLLWSKNTNNNKAVIEFVNFVKNFK